MKSIPQIIKDHHLEKQFIEGQVVLEVGESPSDPKQKETRVRRQCAYDRLLSRCVITKGQRDCLDQFSIICEQAVGKTKNIYAIMNSFFYTDTRNGRTYEPTFAQSRAYGKLFKIKELLGSFQNRIIVMLTVGNMDCQTIGRMMHIEKNKLYGCINSACIRLEEIMQDENYLKK